MKKRQDIIFTIEFIAKMITVFAVIFFGLSVIGMIENMHVGGAQLTVAIICIVWLGIYKLYTYAVNR